MDKAYNGYIKVPELLVGEIYVLDEYTTSACDVILIGFDKIYGCVKHAYSTDENPEKWTVMLNRLTKKDIDI